MFRAMILEKSSKKFSLKSFTVPKRAHSLSLYITEHTRILPKPKKCRQPIRIKHEKHSNFVSQSESSTKKPFNSVNQSESSNTSLASSANQKWEIRHSRDLSKLWIPLSALSSSRFTIESNIVFCRLSRSWKVQFAQKALRTDGATTTTVLSQRSGFYMIYVSFHLFKIRQVEVNGVHEVIVLSFMSNYKKPFEFSDVNVQVIHCVC